MGEMNIVPMLPPPPQPRLFDHLRTKRFLYFVLSLLIVVSLAWPQTHGDIDISITRTAEGRNGVPERIAAPDGSVLNVKAYGARRDGDRCSGSKRRNHQFSGWEVYYKKSSSDNLSASAFHCLDPMCRRAQYLDLLLQRGDHNQWRDSISIQEFFHRELHV